MRVRREHRPIGLWRAALCGITAAAVTLASMTWPKTTAEAAPTHQTGHDHHAMVMQQLVQKVTPAEAVMTPAANVRVRLNQLLGEHVYLAARASGAALGGQQAGFQAAAGALDENSVDIAKVIGTAYGQEAEAAFLPLWRSHIGMVVDYVGGLAADDQAKQEKAVGDLLGYTNDLAVFLNGANENLPKDAVQGLVKDHVLTLKTVIDGQKARNQPVVYDGLRGAIAHMGKIADPLAAATAVKFSMALPGDPMAASVSYRVALNNLLAEHVYLAASASLGALGGNQAQFQAAANSLDANSVDVAKGIGVAYGPEAEAAFLPLWRAHIGMVVDYVGGLAAGDQAKQDKAVGDLIGYTGDFAAFLSGANENLPKDAVQELTKMHILTLKDVIDAQKAGDAKKQFAPIRGAGGHMGMIADPIAQATAIKFPEKLGGVAQAAPSTTASFATEIRQFAYRPGRIEVPLGTTVTWTNQDGAQHSVTSANGAFDSGLFAQGGTFSREFHSAGEFAYFCTRHPSMTGTVTVVG
jgi:plastocyanin